jgi:GDPmannose 4,6-dehydratase
MEKVLINRIICQNNLNLEQLLPNKNYKACDIQKRTYFIKTGKIDCLYHDPHKDNKKFTLYHWDLTDSTSLIRVIQKREPEEIYNV